ncbi:hypothetical protein HPB48_013355 [Haemaphysalis longicornis]|uniref:Uncharacterized protein n=1 Tax=Haemaphysalis longicornis TaxID=44386 RepID=A0A9J6FSR7_HAELO|nr:hypothetical protein HPB48_013355 [Haemaphysalis longicornis]
MNPEKPCWQDALGQLRPNEISFFFRIECAAFTGYEKGKHMVQTQMASGYPQYVTQNGAERADGKDGSFALPIVTTNGVEQQTELRARRRLTPTPMHAPGALTFTPPTQFRTKVAMATEVARAPPSRASLQQHSNLEGIVKQKLSADAGAAAARMRIAYLEQPGTLEARDITGAAVDKVRIHGHTTRVVGGGADTLTENVRGGAGLKCDVTEKREKEEKSG